MMKKIEQLITRYFDGSLNGDEARELLSLLERSEENRRLFLRFYHIRYTPASGEFHPADAWNGLFGNLQPNAPRERKTSAGRRRKLIYTALAAAACVAAALVIHIAGDNNRDIMRYADSAHEIDMNASKIILFLSDDKSVEIEQRDAEIDYVDDEIIINSQSAATKEESSVYNQLVTPYGRRSTVVFSDGTKVWINSGTRLVYPLEFSKDSREILVDGEIYIEVAKDPSRPFIVRSEQLSVRVTGTKFNVRAYGSEEMVSVVLVSGSVTVSPNGAAGRERILNPDQKYTLSEGRISVEQVDAMKYILWKDGLLHLESTSMKEILGFLSRYYNKTITCDPQVYGLHCSGKLDLKDDLGAILAGLSNTAPVVCRENDDKTYHIEMKH